MYKKISFRLGVFFFLIFGQLKVMSQQNFSFFHKLPNGLQINVTGIINKSGKFPNLDVLVDAKGMSNVNARLYWEVNYEYNQTIQNTTVEFFIKKGRVEINKLKIKNIPSVNKITGFKREPFYEQISVPAIMSVSGEKNIKEGERASLTVRYTGDATDYIWKWYEIQGAQNDVLLATGESVTLPWFKPGTRRCYVVGVHNNYGFTTEKQFFNIVVDPLWIPQKMDFSIWASKSSIVESESVELAVSTSINKSNLVWVWYETISGEVKKLESTGKRITVTPKENANYKVRAEIDYGLITKLSDFSESAAIQVRQIIPPPIVTNIQSNISLKTAIRDTQSVVLSADIGEPQASQKDIAIEWMNKNTSQLLPYNNSKITVSPVETTTYMVRTIRKVGAYKKVSSWKEITIAVIATSKAPEIFSDTVFCGKNSDQLKIRFRKGRLGNGSQKWNLYSGAYGYGGVLLQSVTDDKSFSIPFPQKTASFYISPEFDQTIYKQFSIRIIEKPEYISDLLLVNKNEVCKGDAVKFEVNMEKVPSGTNYLWFQETNSGYQKTLPNLTEYMNIVPEENMKYCVKITNNLCGINKTQCNKVKIFDYNKIRSIGKNQVIYKQSGISINIPTYADAQGATWKWYPNYSSDHSVSGNTFTTSNKKVKNVALRAEGACGVKDVSTFSLNWKKTRHLFYFFNVGTITNDFEKFKNIYFTIGTESVYLRVKNNIDMLARSVSPYQCNNQKILNYPINSNTYYQFTNDVVNKRASYLIGFMTRGKRAKFYFGGGYGERKLYWGANIYQYYSNVLKQNTLIENIEQSLSGGEAEAGLFFDFNRFNMMIGANVLHDPKNNQTFADIQAGIGFSKKRKNKK